jgi:hypothetical protein
MRNCLWLVILSSLVAASAAWAQEVKQPSTSSGEIQIPSGQAIDRMLDKGADMTVKKEYSTSGADGFSTSDAKAIQQMEQRAKEVDRDVMKGICTGC